MTFPEIARRNRGNAQKSNGPRTSGGMAAAAQNARRQGATARPVPHNVATWMRIILDAPHCEGADMMPQDERGVSRAGSD